MEQKAATPQHEVRKSLFAGSWYPGTPEQLARTVDDLLGQAASVEAPGQLVALVAPHAGYAYSGAIAAAAYKQLAGLPEGSSFDRVVVISPSHHPHGGQLLVSTKRYYETPLGPVEIDERLLETVLQGVAPLRVLHLDNDQEHSLEIQLPFLQRVLPSFQLVPIMMEDQTLPTCRRLADALAKALPGQRALIVASTDLSHFRNYTTARALDQAFLDDVANFNPEELARGAVAGKSEACGTGPVVTALLAARQLGASQATILAYANSGDVTGDRWRVVGYGAAAVWR